jgi:hypothetical protein
MSDVVALKNYTVTTDRGESYDMTKIPAADSALVAEAKGVILQNLTLDKVTANLDRAGKLIFVAYNGVARAPKLRGAVIRLSDDLGKLSSECELTMQAFQTGSNTILKRLKDVFNYLVKGYEKQALQVLVRCGETAGKMADKAEALADKFEELGDDAVEIAADAAVEEGKEEERRLQYQEDKADFEAKTARAKQLAGEITAQKARLQELIDQVTAKAETAENRAFALSIVSAITKPIGEGIGAFAGVYTRSQMPPSLPPSLPRDYYDAPPRSTRRPSYDDDAPPPRSTRRPSDDDDAPPPRRSSPTLRGSAGAASRLAATSPPTRRAPPSDDDAPPPRSTRRPSDDDAPPPRTGPSTRRPSDDDAPPPRTGPSTRRPSDDDAPPPRTGPSTRRPSDDDAPPPRTTSPTRRPGEDKKDEALSPEEKESIIKSTSKTLEEVGDSTRQMSDDFYGLVESYRTERLRYLELMQDLLREERETLASIAEYAVRMTTLTEQIQIVKAARDSLHQAVGALKEIVAALRVTSTFWKQMANYCTTELDSSDLLDKIELFKDEPKEDRIAIYVDDDFKLAVVCYLAAWKALELVAQEYSAVCAQVTGRIYEDFQKNPTIEESIRDTPKLAAELLASANTELEATDEMWSLIESELEAEREAA